MTEYTEQAQMVDALRHCGQSGNCKTCPRFDPNVFWHDCDPALKQAAADMIEAQYRQIEEPRQEIAEKDKEIISLALERVNYPDEEIEREERCAL